MFGPESLGVLNGLLVELLVLVEVRKVGFAVLAGALVSFVCLGLPSELLVGNLLEKGLGNVVSGNGARLGNAVGRRSLLFGHCGGGSSPACIRVDLRGEGFAVGGAACLVLRWPEIA